MKDRRNYRGQTRIFATALRRKIGKCLNDRGTTFAELALTEYPIKKDGVYGGGKRDVEGAAYMYMTGDYRVALLGEVFENAEEMQRLPERLGAAQRMGAQLAVLPELPLNSWSPATKIALDSDAEPPEGPRHRLLSQAAHEVGIGLLGGVIVISSGRRYNCALLFDSDGRLVMSYNKVHLPQEPGFWEACHYEPGTQLPTVSDALGPRIGIQTCSDAYRSVGSQLLAAQRADIILAPRASERGTVDKWRLAYRAMAMSTSSYVVSVNRPGPEAGAPHIAASPSGELLVETTDTLTVLTLDMGLVTEARRDYPGYLDYPAAAYTEGWWRHSDN